MTSVRISHLIAATLPVVCSAAARSADAADYCIKLSGSATSTYVGKGFTPPSSGTCKAWQGFCTNGCSPDNVQIGIACTASNNSHISFGITTYYLLSNRQFDFIRLNLPSHTGNGNFNYQNPALGETNYTAAGASCSTVPVP